MKAADRKQINIDVGEHVKKYRIQAGYTREKFSELVDISPQFLASVEYGSAGISITTLKKMCEILGISSDRILWDSDNPISLDERVSHIDKKYMGVIETVVQK